MPSSSLATAISKPCRASLKHSQLPPLLRLPAELRNRIYSEVLGADSNPFELTSVRLAPPLLSVCRQINHEASGLFYSSTIFVFNDPSVCTRFLSRLAPGLLDLIPEIRYDCSEICTEPSTWRLAFQDLPGMDEDRKMDKLKADLAERGVFLRDDVLKAGLKVNGKPQWTADPLSEARDAVDNGWLVGRVVFV